MEAEPKSRAQFILEACGPLGLLILLSAAAAFVLTILLLARGRNSAAWAALILIVPMPVLIGLFASINAWNNGWAVVALADVQLKPSELAGLYAELLIPTWVAMLLSVPTYFAAVLGLLIYPLVQH